MQEVASGKELREADPRSALAAEGVRLAASGLLRVAALEEAGRESTAPGTARTHPSARKSETSVGRDHGSDLPSRATEEREG